MNTFIQTMTDTENLILLPQIITCAWCSKIKRSGADHRLANSWVKSDEKISLENALISHSICPSCSNQIKREIKSS